MRNTHWLRESFPPKSRLSTILFEAENILEPVTLKELLQLILSIRGLKSAQGKALWESKCQRTSLNKCTELSILEGFTRTDGSYDSVTIASLSNIDAVLSLVNMQDKTSHITGAPFKAASTLGSVTYSPDGRITGAKAMLLTLVGVNSGAIGSVIPGEEAGDQESLLFEQMLIDLVNQGTWSNEVKAFPFTQRSVNDLVKNAVADDYTSLAAGNILIFTYVCVNLGKFNSVEHRVWLSVAGILAVVMGTISSFGVCQLLGFAWSQMNRLLPFLMLGVGIDDMFVIMQAWENLTAEEKKHDMVTRFGIALNHAGVAITITSVTDLFAFAIGARSVMPGLQSFCVYAAVGIFFIYIFQCTFFLGWFVLDQKRLEETKDSCLFWVKKPKSWEPSDCSQNSILTYMFENIASVLTSVPVKLFVIAITATLVAFAGYGVSRLERNFDAGSFVEEGTYLKNYMDSSAEHFPTSGDTSSLYMADLDYAQDLGTIGKLAEKMQNLDVIDSFDSWYPAFIEFVNKRRKSEFGESVLPNNPNYTKKQFEEDITIFLNDPDGLTYRNNFEFPRPPNSSAPPVILSSMKFSHVTFPTTAQAIAGMEKTFEAIKSVSFSGNVFATSEPYTMWLMIDIITEELVWNVLLALMMIFICTLVLIMDLATSLLVLLTVALTIFDTAGFLQFWGLFLDQDFAIFLTISIGLCVDYAMHMAHSFMILDGSRNQRMITTLTNIGPAVLNGGLSTFCAFVLLAFSKSQTFLVFFKVFSLVVVFGLFHGLIFLPVVLSLIGPESQHWDDDIGKEPNEEVWAEKSMSNRAFSRTSSLRPKTMDKRQSITSIEQEARRIFEKQRMASNPTNFQTENDQEDLQSVSPSDHRSEISNDERELRQNPPDDEPESSDSDDYADFENDAAKNKKRY